MCLYHLIFLTSSSILITLYFFIILSSCLFIFYSRCSYFDFSFSFSLSSSICLHPFFSLSIPLSLSYSLSIHIFFFLALPSSLSIYLSVSLHLSLPLSLSHSISIFLRNIPDSPSISDGYWTSGLRWLVEHHLWNISFQCNYASIYNKLHLTSSNRLYIISPFSGYFYLFEFG